ncbi:MAG: hypothetical protein KF858_10845 [Candidatus Sumerlaeia bacterium]|nr:hypothetical protein [Candidatus Sumerlaeia bacterium]
MMIPRLRLIRSLFEPAPPPGQPPALEDEIAAGAGRFGAWVGRGRANACPVAADSLPAAERAVEALLAARPGEPLPEEAASDAAAFLGEVVRVTHGGHWGDDPLFGLALLDVGGLPGARLLPLALVEKKRQLGTRLSWTRFFETLPARLDGERTRPMADPGPMLPRLLAAESPVGAVQREAAAFGRAWQDRFGSPLVLSLQGVRELERFLRSQFFLCGLPPDAFVQAGLFVGEVGRGLFGGEWDFAEARETGEPARIALRWPELPYYPVGRVLRLLTDQPEGEALDEYLRLIPAARKELRGTAPEPI